ncbi:hypothetical protein BC828DRAFT_104195 [Blastocladiella britannica]|nr:hypothetical protein BC828DRAFT_104195 [Blastocladiella britannica]
MSKRDRAGADLDRDSPAPSDNPSGGDPSTAAARAWVRATVGDTPPPRKRSNPGPRPLEHLAVHLPPSPLVPRHHHHTHFQQPQQQQPQYFFAPPTDAAMAGMGSTPPATMETSSMAVGAPHLILSVPLPPSSLSADGCSGGGIGGGGGALYFPPPGAPSPGIVGSPPYPHLLPQYQQQQQQHPQFAQFQQQPQYHHGMVDSLAHSTEQLSMRSRGSSQSNGVAPFLGQHVPSPAELHGALARLDAGQRPNASASTSGSVADSFDMGTEIGGQTTPTHEHVPKRRPRATKEQLEILEDAFLKWSAPPTTLRDDLAARVGMTPRSVQIWFQNKRAKVKLAQRKAQAEVVASSGSGQQDPGVASTHAAPSDGTQEQQQQQQRLGGKSHSSSSPSPPRDQPTTSSSRLPMTIMVPVDYSEAQQQHQQHHHHQSGTELGPADYPLPLSAATTAPPTPVPTFGGDRSAAASNAANAVYGHSDFSAASSAAAMDLLGFFTLTTDSLLIGTWRRISMDRSRTLVCAYSLHNRYFRWTVTDGQHTFRMEVPFSTVRTMVLQRVPEPPQDSSAMRPISPTTAEMSAVPMSAIMLRNQARPPAELTLTLSQAPAYWMELANTTTGVREWTRCHDFTENRQADLHLTHKLRGDCDAMRNQVQQILLADVGLRSIGYISADLFPPPPTGPAFPAEGTPMAMTPVDALFSPVSPYMHRPPQEPMSLIYAEMLSPTTVVPPATSSAGYSPMQSPTGAFMVPPRLWP